MIAPTAEQSEEYQTCPASPKLAKKAAWCGLMGWCGLPDVCTWTRGEAPSNFEAGENLIERGATNGD